MSDKSKLIEQLYNDPSFGYIGMESLFKKAKALNKNITKDDVRKWYASNIEVARFQKERPKFKGFKIASDNPNSWQIDLAFWMKKRGQRPSEGGKAPLQPILTAVNINSRIGYAQLLDNKRAKTVLDAVKSFVKTNKVEIVTSDNGSEFMNKSIQRFFKDKNIDHYNNEPGDHQTMGKIERFNRTLKQRIIRLPNRDNIDNKLLQKLIQNYNTTPNRAIGMTPDKAKGEVMEKELEHNKEVMENVNHHFNEGDTVLYKLNKGKFDKEDARWSKSVYEIVGIDGYRVQIRSKNKRTMYKSPNDIKLVNAKPTQATFKKGDVFEVEKVLGHKKMKDGRNKYHIKWVGYKEPTWEPQDNLRLVNKNRMSTIEKKYFKSIS